MLISDSKRLFEIQKEFNEKFPFLKLEFYKGKHESKEGSPEKQHLDARLTIGEVRKVHNRGDISISGNQKVSTLERNFYDTYGLNVQVFRHSRNIWLQTTATDEWTLSEQNEHGKSESEFYANAEEVEK